MLFDDVDDELLAELYGATGIPDDLGTVLDSGHVKITGRKKDLIITAGGKNVTPSEWENELKFSPYVTDAVVIGDKRRYLVCLIMIDLETVEGLDCTEQ